MAKRVPLRIGPRDLELLQALDALVLTPAQVTRLSRTFRSPFPDESTVRRRLRKLQSARLVHSFPYAFSERGQSPCYWKLTRDGFRLLYGADIPLPKRRVFEAIAPGRHHHTLCLTDLVVHLLRLAHRDGYQVVNLTREGGVKIETKSFALYPDFTLQLVTPSGTAFNFHIELDNGTERVRSKQAVESLERKIRGYDAHQSQFAAFDHRRYVVLFVTTRSTARVDHILDAVRAATANRQRRTFLTAGLEQVLNATSLTEPVFCDLHGPASLMLPH